MASATRRCPACGLEMPRVEMPYERDFNCSPECWSLFEEVLAAEFQDAVLFGRVHQLTVDAYAAQHPGGRHRDKSIAVHVVGLYLVFERGFAPIEVAPHLQKLASPTTSWPHFDPPAELGPFTIFDVASVSSREVHATKVRAWAQQVWSAWSPHHAAIAEFAQRYYGALERTTGRDSARA